MSNRQEIEMREAAARDKADGWVSEFAFALPMMVLSAVVWMSAMIGMHYIEMGSFFTDTLNAVN